MSKDEGSGGFLSRVARLVRRPGTEEELPGTGTAADREALKRAIERKRRNDQIRKREMAMLRRVIRRVQSNAAAEGSTAFATEDSGGERERTIEKIDAIEAQMAQNWWSEKEQGVPHQGLRIDDQPRRPRAAVGHLGARRTGTDWMRDSELADSRRAHASRSGARTTPRLPIGFGDEPPDSHSGLQDADLGSVEAAALAFASGDVPGAERALREALVREADRPAAFTAWLTLLDFYRVQGDVELFEESAAEFGDLFRATVPRWPWTPTQLALSAESALSVWTCPAQLDAVAVHALGEQMATADGPGCVDWSALEAADVPAAQALLELFETWAEGAGEWRFVGAAVLRRRLKASTPSGRRENDAVWWRLRLAALRLMQRVDEFDLAALDYCVTYGVVPPDWSPPRGRFQGLDALPPEWSMPRDGAAPTEMAGATAWPAMGAESHLVPDDPDAGDGPPPLLAGECLGKLEHTLELWGQRLDAHPKERPWSIDCDGLVRLDVAAAGALQQWLQSTRRGGVRVELVGVSRLVAAFLRTVGFDRDIPLRLREY